MIEAIQAAVSTWLSGLTTLLPLGFAFGAGMVSTVNPCGFVMLPAFLGMYVSADRAGHRELSGAARLLDAIRVGAVISLGFVVLFGASGTAIAAGGRALVDVMPWAAVAIGVLLSFAGLLAISGRKIYANWPARLASSIGNVSNPGARAYFLFGIAFAVASLSCTLPIFLAVVGSAVAVEGLSHAAAQFVLFALGMGAVVTALAISAALFQGALHRGLRRVMRFVEPTGAILMTLAGVYIVYYWLFKAGLLRGL